jgi:hypothetical protein
MVADFPHAIVGVYNRDIQLHELVEDIDEFMGTMGVTT